MTNKLRFAASVCVLFALAAASTACGAADTSSSGGGTCAYTVLQVSGRIAPESSGLSCAEIAHNIIAVPSTPGPWRMVWNAPGTVWKCDLYPSSGHSVDLLTCNRGSRRFAIRRVT